ncbi:MAG: LVIVD repeat-containing protein [Candidatus Heimdallarchaeaceae archaeon]
MFLRRKIGFQTLFQLFILLGLLIFTQLASAENSEVTLTEIGKVEIPGILFDVDIENDLAYVAEYSSNKFHIIDISNPISPIELGNFTVNLPHYIDVSNGIAYISAWTDGVQIYNVSNPTSSYKISDFLPGIVGSLIVSENLLFVGSDYGFNILDISNPATPLNLSYFYTGGNTHDFFVDDTLLYIMAWNWTTSTSWIKVIDFTDPENPFEISQFDLGSVCYDIHVIGDFVYLASSYYGIKIIDFSTISEPSFILSHDLDGEAFSLEVKEDILYLGNGYSGLHVFDVSNKSEAVELAHMTLGGSVEELEIRDNHIYVVVDNVGLLIIEISGLKTGEVNASPLYLVLIAIGLLAFRGIKRIRLTSTNRRKK